GGRPGRVVVGVGNDPLLPPRRAFCLGRQPVIARAPLRGIPRFPPRPRRLGLAVLVGHGALPFVKGGDHAASCSGTRVLACTTLTHMLCPRRTRPRTSSASVIL